MGKRILIVEPVAREWETLREVFLLRGDEPVWAQGEMEALRLFGASAFDLVLIEALLPKSRGYDLCRKLKYTPRGRSARVVVTGSILRNLRLAQEVRHKYGADDVLVKPLDAAVLTAKLNRWLLDAAVPAAAETALPETEFANLPLVRALIGTLPTEGDLRDVPGYVLIPYLASFGDAGVLSVVSGPIEKLVYFQGRRPVYVTSNVREESLGRVLLDRGRITEDQYRESLDRMRATGRRQGEVLMEMGQLTHHDLFDAIVEQARRKLVDLCGWTDGRYSFVLEDFHCGQECLLDIDVVDLVRRALRQLAPERVLAGLAGLASCPVLRVADPLAAATDLPAPERRVLSRVDGKRTLSDLAAESDLGPSEFHPMMLGLLATGNLAVLPGFEGTLGTVDRAAVRAKHGVARPGADLARAIAESYDGFRSPDSAQRLALPVDGGPGALRERFARITEPLATAGVDALPPQERLRAHYVLRRAKIDFDRLTGGPGDGNGKLKTSVRIADRAARLESELAFQRGLAALEDGAMEDAVEAFATAHALAPDISEYPALLAWATYETSTGEPPAARHAKAESLLAAARALGGTSAVVPTVEGRFRAAQERWPEALAAFEEVLAQEPWNVEALRALLDIERRLFPETDATSTDADVAATEEMIGRAARDLYHRTHYQVLSVDRAASFDEIKRSFFQQTELLRDAALLRRASPVVREEADALAARFEEAYEVLSDPERRTAYDAFLDLAEGRHAGPATGAGTIAERAFAAGRDLLGKGEFRAAQGHFARAVEAYPLDPRYAAYLAAAIFRQNRMKVDQLDAALRRAREWIGRALLLDDQAEDANLVLGRIFAATGRAHLARRALDRALSANPENVEALAERVRLGAERRRAARAAASPAADVGGMDEAVLSYVYKIDALDDRVRRQNYFEILGVAQFAGAEEIEKGYHRAKAEASMSEILDLLPEEARRKLHRISDRIDQAYHTLGDEQKAAEYRRDIRATARRKREATAPAREDKPQTIGARVRSFLNRPIGAK
jgi:CheY-like chemotaxis protein/tetratricopeptide (TPR) repeat protein